ncbi:hypothetical protein ACLKMH_05725 [Psychromonas sp. KJ10-10]|uniref:hypothetical protein n=1 Tax=Psychromonas sp. KJ10-10 TaxID=3391823 RepID=UPI0039B61ABD
MAEMKKYSGTRYDASLIDMLMNNEAIVSGELAEKTITSQELKPEMILKYNILTDAHILVLPEGHVFSDVSILKLKQFENNQNTKFSLIVEEPSLEVS